MPNEIANINSSTIQRTGTTSVFADAQTFNTSMRMAQCLAESTIVPKEYHGNVGNCMIAIEMAQRIGASPMMVMQNLYIVNGRPGWSSQWIIAMINASHRYKTELQFEFGHAPEDGGLSCRAWAEDYNGHKVYGAKITMALAQSEGWLNKTGSKWKTMPEVMIQYRAASFFGRMNCPDMIMGIYSAEEVQDMGVVDADYVVTPDTGEVVKDESSNPITQEQRQQMIKLAQGYFGKDNGNALVIDLIKSEGFESSYNVTVAAWGRIMDAIEQEHSKAGETAQDGSENASRENTTPYDTQGDVADFLKD